jgi:hypothetical protein
MDNAIARLHVIGVRVAVMLRSRSASATRRALFSSIRSQVMLVAPVPRQGRSAHR